MAGFTAQEQALITKIQEARVDPSKSPGQGFSIDLLLAIFARIVTLRDFAAAQVVRNTDFSNKIASLDKRITSLEVNTELSNQLDTLNNRIIALEARVEALETTS